nr:MAG TPA: hypothetical protein [Caudoviricetes sp.]
MLKQIVLLRRLLKEVIIQKLLIKNFLQIFQLFNNFVIEFEFIEIHSINGLKMQKMKIISEKIRKIKRSYPTLIR